MPEQRQPDQQVPDADRELGREQACDAVERGAGDDLATRLDGVRDGKYLGDGAHPARQVVERHVDAAEDEQDGEDQVGEDGHLAHAQPDRRVRDAERRAREGRRHHHEQQ